MGRKAVEYVHNGMINVPSISIEYRGFTIKPKLDMGSTPWSSNGNTIRKGYVVVRDGYNPMPGGAWAQSVIEAKVMIDTFIEAEENAEKFWMLLREKQGLAEYQDV